MSRIDITTSAAPLSDGMLQTANPLDATLQVVTDNVGNSSTVSLSTTETQINSILRIKTDNAELLDIENSSGNRFNINRDVQKVNLDFASNPTGSTSIVGAIRTFIDGTNLSDVAQFQENGQVTFTERVKLESDSTVTTQTSSVIQSSTANANLVIAPNANGALLLNIPDGTAVGGNARGVNAVDLQMARSNASQVVSGSYSIILAGASNKVTKDYSISGGINCSNEGRASILFGNNNTIALNCDNAGILCGNANTLNSGDSAILSGRTNTLTSAYGVIAGGQGNTGSTSSHVTIVGGSGNTASGQYSVTGGRQSTATSTDSIAFGRQNNATSPSSFATGQNSTAASSYAEAHLYYGYGYLLGQNSYGVGADNLNILSQATGRVQYSTLTAYTEAALTTGATQGVFLDGNGLSGSNAGLIIPSGSNRAWNVQVNWVAIVTTITGTATGISVGDVVTSIDLLAFKKIGGVSSASAHTSTATKLMVTTPAAYAACSIAFTAGASQEMALTFTGPTFVGGGSVTMRVVARIELAEVAF